MSARESRITASSVARLRLDIERVRGGVSSFVMIHPDELEELLDDHQQFNRLLGALAALVSDRAERTGTAVAPVERNQLRWTVANAAGPRELVSIEAGLLARLVDDAEAERRGT